MWNQSRYKPMEETEFFANNSSAQPLVPGTVSRDRLMTSDVLYSGRSGGKLADTFPFPITARDLTRGQERFNVYCSPCHGKAGDGTGMIVKRGFSPPPDYHIARLRSAPVGHFFDVMTNGYGAMYSYASRVPPDDRWRIAAYIRVLQRSSTAVPAERPRSPVPAAMGGTGAGGVSPSGTPGPGANQPGISRDLMVTHGGQPAPDAAPGAAPGAAPAGTGR